MATSTTRQRYWYLDKRRIGIVEKSNNATTQEAATSDYSSVSVAAKTIRVYGIFKPDALNSTLTADDDPALTEIPVQFHEVIVTRAIASGYKDPRNMQIDMATYFDAEYDKGLREAKKFSKSRYRRGGFIKAYDF